MRSRRVLMMACLAALGAHPASVQAHDELSSSDHTPTFDLDPWMRQWGPHDPSELTTIPIHPLRPTPLRIDQELPHPAVPLPPALTGVAVLGAGWMAMRGARHLRRRLSGRR